MLFATDQIGMSILIDPALAHSVMFDSQPYGGYEDAVGFSACYQDYTKAVRPNPEKEFLPLLAPKSEKEQRTNI